MSLRTNFTGTLDAKLAQARTAGYNSVLTDSLTAITTAMTNAGNQGKSTFTVNIAVTYQPADLRLLGALWYAYQTGVVEALAEQDIMMNEVTAVLNTSDQLATSLDLKFAF
jgi:Mrp family chromosome partitioning ATPase